MKRIHPVKLPRMAADWQWYLFISGNLLHLWDQRSILK